jgi:hypothetical protein
MRTFPEVRDPSTFEPPVPVTYKRHNGPNKNYEALMLTIQSAAGEWVALSDGNAVAGKSLKQKVVTIHTAARGRKMTIQTTCQHGRVYVRLVDRKEAQ